jgi:hypothetical protein
MKNINMHMIASETNITSIITTLFNIIPEKRSNKHGKVNMLVNWRYQPALFNKKVNIPVSRMATKISIKNIVTGSILPAGVI